MKKKNDNKIKKTGLGVATSRRISNTIIYIVLILMTIVWLFPFFGILLESFKTETEMQTGYLFPKEFGFDHYIRLFTKTDFLVWFKNTAIMVRNPGNIPRISIKFIRVFLPANLRRERT